MFLLGNNRGHTFFFKMTSMFNARWPESARSRLPVRLGKPMFLLRSNRGHKFFFRFKMTGMFHPRRPESVYDNMSYFFMIADVCFCKYGGEVHVFY